VLVDRSKELIRRFGRTTIGKNIVYASVLRDPARMRFSQVESWPAGVARLRRSRVSVLVESTEPRHRVAADQRGGVVVLARAQRADRAVR
jgi:hypothetical protein